MKTREVIDLADWNELVEKTYGRPYNLQQQDGCVGRGVQAFTVPEDGEFDYERDSVPEEVNHETMGVSLAAWLARDPKQKLSDPDAQEDYCLELWWHRNFYPSLQSVANDLHARGLLKAGTHSILIDW
jgi:hypothetical protein